MRSTPQWSDGVRGCSRNSATAEPRRIIHVGSNPGVRERFHLRAVACRDCAGKVRPETEKSRIKLTLRNDLLGLTGTGP